MKANDNGEATAAATARRRRQFLSTASSLSAHQIMQGGMVEHQLQAKADRP
jgi:hypothetical protein